jgi:MerR family transcriptional regulator, light-induced transcriptional regulator
VIQNSVFPSQPASRDENHLLIADVAALTGVPPPQLRSWEQAGLIHPRRSPNAIRLYSIEDVARVRLVKRSLINPGRRGSLRRLVKALAAGTLAPGPEDYEGLISTTTTSAPMAASQ